MPRELVPIKTKAVSGPTHGSEENHPAFAQIGCSRVSATPGYVLYGSDFRHNHFMTITIRRSTLSRGLSNDWPHGHEELIEVALSESQWAAFVSTPNSGLGTQCTLQYYRPEGQVPQIPEPPNRTQQFTKEAKEDMDEALAEIHALREALKDAPGLSGKSRRLLEERVERAERSLTSSLPFVAEQFAEHVEKTTDRAKTEVHAYIENVIHRAGIEAIRNKMPFTVESPHELPANEGLVISGTADDD